MASARGYYSPRSGSAGESARTIAKAARDSRLAASDRAYRAALGLLPGEPIPRSLGAVMRGCGRPHQQHIGAGRHSFTIAAL